MKNRSRIFQYVSVVLMGAAAVLFYLDGSYLAFVGALCVIGALVLSWWVK